jgi:hypothetical protein
MLPQQSQGRLHRFHGLDQLAGDGHQLRRGGGHAVEDHAVGGGVDEVEHVVELRDQLVDVLPVDGGDEGLVQEVDGVVGDAVAVVLQGMDLARLELDVPVVRDHGVEGVGPGQDHPAAFSKCSWKIG